MIEEFAKPKKHPPSDLAYYKIQKIKLIRKNRCTQSFAYKLLSNNNLTALMASGPAAVLVQKAGASQKSTQSFDKPLFTGKTD